MRFKHFLINEDAAYLGQKIGDILNAVHDLVENGKSMGTRQLVKNSEQIVNQIRGILHTHWTKADEKILVSLQKAAAAIMRAIKEKGDINEVLPSVADELEELSTKMGTPTNDIGVPEKKSVDDDEQPENNMPNEPVES